MVWSLWTIQVKTEKGQVMQSLAARGNGLIFPKRGCPFLLPHIKLNQILFSLRNVGSSLSVSFQPYEQMKIYFMSILYVFNPYLFLPTRSNSS